MEKQTARNIGVAGLMAAATLAMAAPTMAQTPYTTHSRAEYGQQFDRTPDTAREHQRLHRFDVPHQVTRFDRRNNEFLREHRMWDRMYANGYGYGQHQRYGQNYYGDGYRVESNTRISGAVFGALAGALIGSMVSDDGDRRQYYRDRNTNRYYYYSDRDRAYYWDPNYRR